MSPIRPNRRKLSGLALVVTLLAGACSDDGGGSSSSTTRPAPTEEATTSTAPSGAPVGFVGDAGLDLPRTVVYAGVELTIAEATLSNATPATFGRDEPTVGDADLLYLEITTSFVDGYPGDDGFMPVRHFVIETEDGDRRGARGVDDLAEVPTRASADSSATLAFEVTEDEIDGAALVYDDGEHVAARLPLAGDVPESPYPVRVEVGETAQPELTTGCDPAPAEVELKAVEWDVDGGVAVDGTKLARGRSSRADVDHLWLRAELEVTALVGACGGTFANQETFRVTVDGETADGESVEPVNVYSLTLADGATQPMTFLFAVPDDATSVQLVAGDNSASTATFDVELP